MIQRCKGKSFGDFVHHSCLNSNEHGLTCETPQSASHCTKLLCAPVLHHWLPYTQPYAAISSRCHRDWTLWLRWGTGNIYCLPMVLHWSTAEERHIRSPKVCMLAIGSDAQASLLNGYYFKLSVFLKNLHSEITGFLRLKPCIEESCWCF